MNALLVAKNQVSICNDNLSIKCIEKLLEIKIDNKLNFEERKGLCKKASEKVNALARISSLISRGELKLIVNPFIASHFSYCPLVGMLHS